MTRSWCGRATLDGDPLRVGSAQLDFSNESALRGSIVVGVLHLYYSGPMAVINFRSDEPSERALAELTADGSTVSDAIRQALVDSVRLRRREQMRRESLEVSCDTGELAESRRVATEMDELRAW